MLRTVLVLLLSTALLSVAVAHDGPDPLFRWRFDREAVQLTEQGGSVKARLGPDATLIGKGKLLDDDEGGSLFLSGGECGAIVADDFRTLETPLPTRDLTASVWCSIDKPTRWGGLLGSIQDNGDDEKGWLLGYNNQAFTFALVGQDGPGKLTYLEGKTKYELGKTYHVVGVYDGTTMRLYVNGKLDAESTSQSGEIDYPKSAPFVIGAYRDDNEFHGHRGRIREAVLYNVAAKTKWAAHAFSHHAALAARTAKPIYDPLDFVIDPYLQFGTKTSMTVMWRTNRPANGVVQFGETSDCDQTLHGENETELHEFVLRDLKPQTQYFYRVVSRLDDKTTPLTSKTHTFSTAVKEKTPFAFAVISDTQGNPKVSGRLAQHAWGQRPNFLLHPGDLVSTGGNDLHWTEHFFPSMNPLIANVPFYPVLGNHEQNARNYFDYVSLPTPEYRYTFSFGNTQFFMIDSNRNIDPGSEQYTWLESELAKSKAVWKFVCHHHPPYSSDENDYGDLWKTNQSTRGDLRARQLVPLYERFDVDFVWNGHIHSYERTWPIRDNSAAESDAPIYMITGGGGGSLETAGPSRPFFQNTVRHGHHYAMVRINGTHLEIQVYDLENRLFDSVSIKKPSR
ncbi:MAG: LamG-like jellyroll fold domain-containing protein [Planctomycetota bacterium]